MKRFFYCVIIASVFYSCTGVKTKPGSDDNRAALTQTSKMIQAAFAKGDGKEVMKYHHPDVVKALSYDTYLFAARLSKQT